MHSVRLAPTKLILMGTWTTYQAIGDAEYPSVNQQYSSVFSLLIGRKSLVDILLSSGIQRYRWDGIYAMLPEGKHDNNKFGRTENSSPRRNQKWYNSPKNAITPPPVAAVAACVKWLTYVPGTFCLIRHSLLCERAVQPQVVASFGSARVSCNSFKLKVRLGSGANSIFLLVS